jgi:hypothetical protein
VHGAPVRRHAEVADGALVDAPERGRRRHPQAVLLDHEPSRRREGQNQQRTPPLHPPPPHHRWIPLPRADPSGPTGERRPVLGSGHPDTGDQGSPFPCDLGQRDGGRLLREPGASATRRQRNLPRPRGVCLMLTGARANGGAVRWREGRALERFHGSPIRGGKRLLCSLLRGLHCVFISDHDERISCEVAVVTRE